ncbi:hypothetical protein FGO68_gene17703 [Halteria grandinella]|uniref:Uncharacterized protein n=1 Tax=Halteria grandinella TaxID=5974 RepID=A0A8J8NR75_HALGN|nr:hypothetical protein FGO68_gene17703 [Halteria grandinella]
MITMVFNLQISKMNNRTPELPEGFQTNSLITKLASNTVDNRSNPRASISPHLNKINFMDPTGGLRIYKDQLIRRSQFTVRCPIIKKAQSNTSDYTFNQQQPVAPPVISEHSNYQHSKESLLSKVQQEVADPQHSSGQGQTLGYFSPRNQINQLPAQPISFNDFISSNKMPTLHDNKNGRRVLLLPKIRQSQQSPFSSSGMVLSRNKLNDQTTKHKQLMSRPPQQLGSNVELSRVLYQPAPLNKINLSLSDINNKAESKKKKVISVEIAQTVPISPRPLSKRKENSRYCEEELMPIQNEAVRTLFFAQQQVPHRNLMVNLQSQIQASSFPLSPISMKSNNNEEVVTQYDHLIRTPSIMEESRKSMVSQGEQCIFDSMVYDIRQILPDIIVQSVKASPFTNSPIKPSTVVLEERKQRRLLQRRNQQLLASKTREHIISPPLEHTNDMLPKFQQSPSHKAVQKGKFKNLGIQGSNPLQETKAQHYKKQLSKIIVSDSQVSQKEKVVIDPWSHVKPSEASDIDSHQSFRSSQMNQPVIVEMGFTRREEPKIDKRPFKPFANFNKPVTLYEMSRVSIESRVV